MVSVGLKTENNVLFQETNKLILGLILSIIYVEDLIKYFIFFTEIERIIRMAWYITTIQIKIIESDYWIVEVRKKKSTDKNFDDS